MLVIGLGSLHTYDLVLANRSFRVLGPSCNIHLSLLFQRFNAFSGGGLTSCYRGTSREGVERAMTNRTVVGTLFYCHYLEFTRERYFTKWRLELCLC